MTRGARWLFWLTIGLEAVAVMLSWGVEPRYDTIVYPIQTIVLAGVGALIAARHRSNPIGWLLLGFALLNAVLSDVAQGWGLRAAAEGWPAAETAQWVSASSWLPNGFGWLLVFALFPDGRVAGRRWRWVPWTGAVGSALALAGWALGPDRARDITTGRNPYAVADLPVDTMVTVGMTLYVLALLGAVVSLALRWRGAQGIVRQQLKVMALAAALAAVLLPASFVLWYVSPVAPLLAAVALVGLPVAVGVAILRYRLYDIDTLIDRAVVYAAVTALLALLYAAVTLGLGTALGGGSAWITALATLLVAVAFRPLRDRVQDLVDRRFHRARYHARRRMAEFLEAVRAGRSAPEEVEPLLRELLDDPGLRLLVHGPDEPDDLAEPADPADPTWPAYPTWPADPAEPARWTIPVTSGDRRLGTVVLSRRPPADAAAVVDSAGLAIEIARLQVELRRRLAEVQASRARIVTAAHDERRRIERDLHDGAQQRLVSIGLALRHAQHQLGGGTPPHGVAATLDGAVAEITVTIDELRELALGLPPAQLDAGLAPAFEDLARRAPVPVEVRVSAARYSREVEGAAWFIGCEGVTNAVKHARATRIALSADSCDGRLVVTVSDDGVGGATVDGSGLRGLADRVNALGGVLRVDSAAGAGTTLTAELPCGS